MNKIKLFICLTLSILILNTSASFAEMVRVNLKRHIYHKLKCKTGQRCKKNCLNTSKERALKIYKAKPCKICHKKHL